METTITRARVTDDAAALPIGAFPPRCGAKTRRGTACSAKPEPGKKRCKYHGGRSTGAKTEEGKARAKAALDNYRAQKKAEKTQKLGKPDACT